MKQRQAHTFFIERNTPGQKVAKLHRTIFFAQGHAQALHGECRGNFARHEKRGTGAAAGGHSLSGQNMPPGGARIAKKWKKVELAGSRSK